LKLKKNLKILCIFFIFINVKRNTFGLSNKIKVIKSPINNLSNIKTPEKSELKERPKTIVLSCFQSVKKSADITQSRNSRKMLYSATKMDSYREKVFDNKRHSKAESIDFNSKKHEIGTITESIQKISPTKISEIKSPIHQENSIKISPKKSPENNEIELPASLIPMKITREEIQRIIDTIKNLPAKEFELLPAAYVGDLSKLSHVIKDKLRLSAQFSSLTN